MALAFGVRRALLFAAFSVGAAGTLLGCRTGAKSAVGPKGSHVLTCGSGMKACVVRADDICGDEGYHIVEGVSMPTVLGGSSSAYKTRTEVAEMTIRCGLPVVESEGEEKATYKLPPRSDETLPPEEPIGTPSSPSSPRMICTPGSTQACVGPGACQGGQMCLESGAGYGPCDCGDAGPKNSASDAAAPRGPSTSRGDGAPPIAPVPGIAPTPTPLGKQ